MSHEMHNIFDYLHNFGYFWRCIKVVFVFICLG